MHKHSERFVQLEESSGSISSETKQTKKESEIIYIE